MREGIMCPFKVGQRIHELTSEGFVSGWPEPFAIVPGKTVFDLSRPDAIITAITDRGFTYEYSSPVPHGRIAWGEMVTGGECFPEGYRYWVSVD